MDPKKQECRGSYLYGSGYYANQDDAKKRVTGRPASFCAECPGRKRCEEAHVQRVRAGRPEEVETFERRVQEGLRRGASATLVQAYLMKQGQPDPFMAVALANYQQGMADSGRLLDLSAG